MVAVLLCSDLILSFACPPESGPSCSSGLLLLLFAFFLSSVRYVTAQKRLVSYELVLHWVVLPIERAPSTAPDSFEQGCHGLGHVPWLALDLSTTCTTPQHTWMSILKPDQLPTLRQLYEKQTLPAPKAEDVEFPASEEWLDRVSL